MANLINQHEKDWYLEEHTYLDDYDRYESERVDPSTPQAKHARSIVGKWCEGIDTPIYGNMLAKVISVGNYDLGQVNIITFKASKGLFQIDHWKICGGEPGFTTVIGSTWLNITSKRPSLLDIAKFPFATITRQLTCWLEHEGKCFKYKWWKDGSYLYHQYNPYVTNLIGAIYDFGRAFRYGVMLPRH